MDSASSTPALGSHSPCTSPSGIAFASASWAWIRSLVAGRLHAPREVAARARLLATVPELEAPRPMVIDLWRDNPDFADAMSALRAVLDPVFAEGGQVLQVTSSGDGEGKTVVAAGLALALAEAKRATLLVDAHLSAPGLARAFGRGPQEGLAEALGVQAAGVQALIRETPVRNLHLLAAGGPAADPHALLGDPRWAWILDELRARFERIVVDSAPVLASAEARLAASACDRSLLVVCSGETRLRAAEEAALAMADFRASLVGAVLNKYPRLAKTPRVKRPVALASRVSRGQGRLRVLPEAQAVLGGRRR